MIETDIKADLERLTGLNAYPVALPSNALEGVTYQKISDPKMITGLAKTFLVQARFQITFQIPNDYSKALKLEKVVLNAWENITHTILVVIPFKQFSEVISCRTEKSRRINGLFGV